MKSGKITVLAAALCYVLGAPHVFALVDSSKIEVLAPSREQVKATNLITHFITKYHYKKIQLNDQLSGAILDKYIDSLDPNKSYFQQRDIDNFQQFRLDIDDTLRKGNLRPAFTVFNRYRTRLDERMKYTTKLLNKGFKFDVDEHYVFDRTKAAWPKDQAELNELWRKRVKNDVLSLRIAGKKKKEIKETLKKRYEGLARQNRQFNSEDVFQLFMNAYTTSIEPHTEYFSPRTSENFNISMSLSLEGIGAVLQNENEYTIVRKLIPGGPADLSAQLKPEDQIWGVAQDGDESITNVVGWRLDDVVDLIRGPKDSIVNLEVLPKGRGPEGPTKVVTLIRNKIQLEEQAAKSSVIEIGKRKVGVITVPAFYLDFAAWSRGDNDYRSTTGDVKKLLRDLTKEQTIDGLIIDLRGNGGGSLSEATSLTGLFIKDGPIVQVRDATGHIEINDDPDPEIIYSAPMAVLVDRYSASASEIFAGAIQDYRRGIIIGEPTFGKGTVQNLIDLDRYERQSESKLGQLKATVAQFFRVSGASTQHKGVLPDVTFPFASSSNDYGESSLDNALPWDSIRPAKFGAARTPVGAFAYARKSSKQRIRSDAMFQLLLEDAKEIADARKKTQVSLLESRRKDELEKRKKIRLERENRYRAAKGLKPLTSLDEEEDEAGVTEDVDPEEKEGDDTVLTEAAKILEDLIAYNSPSKLQQRQANRAGRSSVTNAPN